jgi:hypothetical protein
MKETQNHLNFTHYLWKTHLTPSCIAVDATAGNGNDAFFIAPLVKELHVFDIQEEAIKVTKEKLKAFDHITYHLKSHSSFSETIQKESVSLIAYNLGYLPGGNKSITTQALSTLKSLEYALTLINAKGLICITLYPGHDEGKKELDYILEFIKHLDKKTWTVSRHLWVNRQLAPEVVLIHKQQWSQ